MTWSHIEERILRLLRGEEQSDKWVFSLLGPQGSGKSEILNSTIGRARAEGFEVAYLEASLCGAVETEKFFKWVFDKLIELGWPLTKPVAPQLDFVQKLVAMASKLLKRRLLVIDQMECLSDENARTLVSNLREYQETVDRASRKQVLCVVAGRVSMQDLSRRANSPNLQFDFETLPPRNRMTATKEVKEYFEGRGHEIDGAALTKLTEYTGGETAFLRMVEPYLKARQIRTSSVEKAIKNLLNNAMDVPQLRSLAELYWIDHELQRCADLLANGRQAFLHDSSGIARDIDILQLRGALVAQPEDSFPYEFRNAIVGRLFKKLYLARHRPLQGESAEDGLYRAARAMMSLQEPKNIDEWRSSLAEAWNVLLHRLDKIHVSFLFRPNMVDPKQEPWAKATPNASCSVKILPRFVVIAEVFVRSDWLLQAEIIPGADFDLSVRRRHLVECWLSFLARGAERALLFHLASEGERVLIYEHERKAGPHNRSVFLVHSSRNLEKKNAISEFLRALKLEPLDWQKAMELTEKTIPTIFEIIDAGMSNAQACLVLMTGDDEARLIEKFWTDHDGPHEHELRPQARANVLFEAGMALGRYLARTILVEFGPLRPFSDVEGFHILRYMDQTDLDFRKRLIRLLLTAKCPADDSTDIWQTTGEFSPASKNKS